MWYLKQQEINQIQSSSVFPCNGNFDWCRSCRDGNGKACFFDGGQFAQIGKATRRIMVPFLYIAMKKFILVKRKDTKENHVV